MGLVGKDTKLAGCVDILECYKKKHAPLDSGDVSPLIYTVNRKEEVYNNINGSKMNPLHINLYSSVVIFFLERTAKALPLFLLDDEKEKQMPAIRHVL